MADPLLSIPTPGEFAQNMHEVKAGERLTGSVAAELSADGLMRVILRLVGYGEGIEILDAMRLAREEREPVEVFDVVHDADVASPSADPEPPCDVE